MMFRMNPESGEAVENDYSADGAGDEYLTETLAKYMLNSKDMIKHWKLLKN